MQDFKQKLLENGYFRQEELVFADCDRNKRARVATLLSKVGAYAGYDYDARGLTHEKLYTMREVFLLSRIALRIHHCPMARDVLDITTWENGARGAHMQRVFEMVDQTGQLCVSVKSEWILVDPLTRKILRPASFTAKPLMTCDRVIDCPDPHHAAPPGSGGVGGAAGALVRSGWKRAPVQRALRRYRLGLSARGPAGPAGEGVPDQLQPGGHPGRKSAPAGHPG